MMNELEERKRELERELSTITFRLNLRNNLAENYPKGFLENLYSKIKATNAHLVEELEAVKEESDLCDFISENYQDVLRSGAYDNHIEAALEELDFDTMIGDELDLTFFFQRYGKAGINAAKKVFRYDLEDCTSDDNSQIFFSDHYKLDQDWLENLNVITCWREDYIDDIAEFLRDYPEKIEQLIEDLDLSDDSDIELFEDLRSDDIFINVPSSDMKQCYDSIMTYKGESWDGSSVYEYISEHTDTLLEHYSKIELFNILF